MSKIVNLGRARKQRQRQDASRRADANALRHGRTKADKAEARRAVKQLADAVDGARLESPPESADEETP